MDDLRKASNFLLATILTTSSVQAQQVSDLDLINLRERNILADGLENHGLVLSQLPDFSKPVNKKIPGFGGTIVSGFRYNPNTKEVGILLSSDHMIKPVIEKQGEQRPKNTKYNRVTIKNFRYRGINVERREVLVDARIRYHKLDKKPWGGLYTTFDQAADITLGANFEVENRQLKTGTYIREFHPDWASGPLGFIYSIFDAAFGVINWVAGDDFVRISDYAGTLAAAYVNLAQPQKTLVDSLFSKVNEWNSQGLVYLNQTDYDPDGIWLLFKADPNQAEKLYQQLGNLVNSYFPGVSVNNQLNLVAANTSPSSRPGAESFPYDTSMKFCNGDVKEQTLRAAYVSFDSNSGWRSQGWVTIPYGKCSTVDLGTPYDNDVYIYIKDETGKSFIGRQHGQQKLFCVHSAQQFDIPKSDERAFGCASLSEHEAVWMNKYPVRSSTNPGVNPFNIFVFGDKTRVGELSNQ